MEVLDTSINDLKLIKTNFLEDHRGVFAETFREDFIKKNFPGIRFIQENESKSSRGVLRGLHFQKPPFAQTKLVRVAYGEVLDVAVDLRLGSPTYGMHQTFLLSKENGLQLFVPKGFAHGFIVLSETAILQYKVDNYYMKESEDRISFDDGDLKIDWQIPHASIIISDRDKIRKSFKDYSKGENIFWY